MAMRTIEAGEIGRAEADVSALLQRTCAGDAEAWQALWSWIDPRLVSLLRQPRFLARIGQADDDRRAIVLDVLTRLRADEFRRLKLFLKARARNDQLSFMSWLTVVAKRVAIDYLRAHPDYVDQRRRKDGDGAPGVWIEVRSLPADSQLPGERPPVTARGTAGELLDYARRELPESQQRALALWVEGATPAQIAAALGVASPAKGEQIVRAALERLRRKFRSSPQ